MLVGPDGIVEEKLLTRLQGKRNQKSKLLSDFLVDENQTITYLTSQGELIQENDDVPRPQEFPILELYKIPLFSSHYWNMVVSVETNLRIFRENTLFLMRAFDDGRPMKNHLILCSKSEFFHSTEFEVIEDHQDLLDPEGRQVAHTRPVPSELQSCCASGHSVRPVGKQHRFHLPGGSQMQTECTPHAAPNQACHQTE